MAVRSLEGALRCRQCIQQATKHAPRRTFTSSSSRQKHGALPDFHPTSNPELDTILSTFRSKIFVPSHLLKQQRALVYRKRNHPVLLNEPISVTIGDEEVPLEPLDHLTDEPNTRRGFGRMLDLMKEPRDWDNLPGFLAGCRTAKRKMGSRLLEKMVRKANENGRQGTVMQCIRRSEATGFALNDLRIVREVMWGARQRAQLAGWDEEGTSKGLAQAVQVMDLLDNPKYGSTRDAVSGVDFKMLPEIVGVVLELAAAKAVRYNDGKDVDSMVAAYAVATLDSLRGETMLARFDFAASDWNRANYRLLMCAPVLHGLDLAAGVLRHVPKIEQDIKSTRDALERVVFKARDVVLANTHEDQTRRGMQIVEDIAAFDRASS